MNTFKSMDMTPSGSYPLTASYSHSGLGNVVAYTANQKEHHRTKTFREEYLAFPDKFQIDFNQEYLFEWID